MCLQNQTMEGQYTFAFQSICKLEAAHFQLNSVASILPLGDDILQFLSSWDRLCFPTLWIRTDLRSCFWPKECGQDHALVLNLDLKKSWLPLFFFSELCHCLENKLGPACWRICHHVQAELSQGSQSHPRPTSPQSAHQLTTGVGPAEIRQVSFRSAEFRSINKGLLFKLQSLSWLVNQQ